MKNLLTMTNVHAIFIKHSLVLWRFSSVGRASALQAEGQRFEPVNLHHYADLAQLAEQLICNQ